MLVVGVPKGDALRYSDLTAEQIAELKKPATDAAAEIGKTNEEYKAMLTEQAKAFGDAQQARAESYANAESARDKAYTKAETDRNAAYNEAEGEREQGWTDLKAEAEKGVSDAVERADAASKAATKAIADVKATEAKLYPVAENVLKGTAKDTFVHVDDAFPSSLLGIEIEGATEQVTTTGKNIVKLNEAKKTSKELELDVKSSGQIIINGTCSGDGLWLKIGTVDVVEGKAYVLSLNKAYSTFGISAWSNSDNKHVVFAPGKSQSAKGTATKTETLSIFAVGGEGMTFNNEVVSVQMEEGTAGTYWEPYTGGKPSPSPEYPQQITVVENPTVKVTGRSLAQLTVNGNGDSDNFFVSPSVQRLTLSFDCAGDWWTGDPNGPCFFVHEVYPESGDFSNQPIGVLTFPQVTGRRVSATIEFGSAITGRYEGYVVLRGYYDKIGKYCSNFMVSAGGSEEPYAPHASQSLTFTLPAEHPFLAKVDGKINEIEAGKADEITVDRDGNVSLIANIGKYTVDTIPYIREEELGFGVQLGMSGAADGYLCAYLKHGRDAAYYNFLVDWLAIPKSYVTFTTVDEVKQFLKGKEFFYQVKEPKTYNLGKINLPALPESVSNVWTDAEVTPKTGIEYTRDVNIVVANLESAIASIS